MNVLDAQRWLDRIDRLTDDPERASKEEDHFHEAVLREIADGNPDAQLLARVALRTTDLDFPRWCA